MIDTTKAHPPIVDFTTWQKSREELLSLEKIATRLTDTIGAARRRLPMTEIKNYTFMGKDKEINFTDLFAGRSQLIVHHFMFDPNWNQGCVACSDDADNCTPHLAHLAPYDISFVRISRASIEKLLAYNKRMGWSVPWVSSHDCSFNQDYGWTNEQGGEVSGFSAYLQLNGKPYLTYLTKGRGIELMSSIAGLLDITPYGRQEKWQEVPSGFPQEDTFSKLRRHDEYESNK
jgi:predicted dithiol-disulfide oxidoreductase (DUF899 family)